MLSRCCASRLVTSLPLSLSLKVRRMSTQPESPDFNHEAKFSLSKSPQFGWSPGQKQPLNQNNSAENTVSFHADKIAPGVGYKLLVNTVLPRPIAFVSTISTSGEGEKEGEREGKEGVANVAPFSFFNVVSEDPPAVMISCIRGRKGLKDTARNILDNKEYTVNLIGEWFVESANYATIEAPSSESEFDLIGLTKVPSDIVKPFRVGESAVTMECKLMHHYPIMNDEGKETADVFIGRVLVWHIRKEVLKDDLTTDLSVLKPVARLGGLQFGRTTEGYIINRPLWDVEKSKFGKE